MFSIWLLLNKVVRSYTVNTIIKSVHVSFLVQNRLVGSGPGSCQSMPLIGGPLRGPPINGMDWQRLYFLFFAAAKIQQRRRAAAEWI